MMGDMRRRRLLLRNASFSSECSWEEEAKHLAFWLEMAIILLTGASQIGYSPWHSGDGLLQFRLTLNE